MADSPQEKKPQEKNKGKQSTAGSLHSADYLAQISQEPTALHYELTDKLAEQKKSDTTDGGQADLTTSLKTAMPLTSTLPSQTIADPEETIAAGLPTIDMNSRGDSASLATLSTTLIVDDTPYIGVIGDYQLIEQIGRGGMGVVYKAHQKKVGRVVALKVIASGSLCAPEDIARFRDEATAAGRLNHPGIVPVYDAGEHDGTHYFSMAYIEGESLASFVGRDKARLDPRRAAKLMEDVCRAVQYAHDRAVIHRDIKPANIMLDKSGQPLLTDFGLAKLVGNEGLTMTGQVMGTPNYMAPEQAKGQQDLISNRTDVYSLGATLYALLAGMPAFVGKTLIETLRKVESAAPAPLTYKGSQVPLDLWIICEKSLAKRPEDRYESAAALADDLQRFLQGFPISARAVGPWTRLVRWSQRNPLIAALLGTIAATLVIATIVSVGFAIQARAEQARAEVAQARAEENLSLIEEILDKVLLSMSESDLAEVPGTQFVREKLLTTAQGYYEKLNSTDQVSAEMIARAAYPLGKMQASLGRFAEAQKSFDNVLEYQKKIVEANPKDAAASLALGQTHYDYAKLGQRMWIEGDSANPSSAAKQGLAMMLNHAAETIAWRGKAHEIDPQNREITRLLANSKMGLALGKVEEQRIRPDAALFQDAEELIIEAQSIRTKLLEVKADDAKVKADLAKGFIALADLRIAKSLPLAKTDPEAQDSLVAESIKLREQAIEIYKSLPPDALSTDMKYDLANCYYACAEDYAFAGKYQKAIFNYEEMGVTLQPLLMSNPGMYKLRKGVADAQYNLAQVYLRKRDDEYWSGYVNDFQDTLVNAVIVDPKNRDALTLMFTYSDNLATMLAADENLTAAVDCLERAKTHLDKLKGMVADSDFIDSIIEKLEQRIKDLRGDEVESDRTAWVPVVSGRREA